MGKPLVSCARLCVVKESGTPRRKRIFCLRTDGVGDSRATAVRCKDAIISLINAYGAMIRYTGDRGLTP